MTKLTMKLICVLSMFVSPALVHAQANGGVESGSSLPSGPSIKDSADKSQEGNQKGQVVQTVMGGIMFAMAAKEAASQNYGMAAMYAMMGMLSMQQAGNHGSAAGSAGYTSSLTDGYGKNPYDYGNINVDDLLKNDPDFKAIESNKKKLEEAGVLNPKTGIATAGGKTFKPSDFASTSAMAAAGVPSAAISAGTAAYAAAQKKAMDRAEKIKLGAMTATNGFAEGGGGAGAFGAGGGSASDSEYAGDYAGMGAMGAGAGSALNRDPSSLAGMQKNYNGEPIGVAGDSIFLMMTRRYKLKERQESFFSDGDLSLQK